MTTLVVGASGATGRLLVRQLLNRGERVRVIVRSPDGLPTDLRDDSRLSVIAENVLELDDAQMARHVEGCEALASCLGHTLSFKGIYAPPRRLVTDATRRLCAAVKANNPQQAVKFVLMNTTGNSNRDLDEAVSFAQRCVIGVLRVLLPPHVDNEKAADFLRTEIGQHDPVIQWVVVRPDGLSNEENVSDYALHPSPQRSAIFDAGTTSRVNVAHFMAALITDEALWTTWKGQMPVIYNREG